MRLVYFFIAGALLLNACKKEGCADATASNYDSKADKDDGSCVFPSITDTPTTTTGSTADTTSTGGNTGGATGGGTTSTQSEYWFSDDNIKCTPYSANPSINNQGILSVVSNPCQSSSAKLDGYFKYGTRPVAGTYNIHDAGTSVGNTFSFAADEFQLIFYSHDSKNWYSQSGQVTLSTSVADSTKLDLTWSNVVMIAADSSSVNFSGTLLGL